MGYDYSDYAIQGMSDKNLPCRKVDLDNIADVQRCLSQDVDSTSPVNFIAVRVFQYLDDKALTALIFTLLNNSSSDSRFIFVSSLDKVKKEQCLPKNYLASFFGARTDMKIRLIAETPAKTANDSVMHNQDEVLVVQKL